IRAVRVRQSQISSDKTIKSSFTLYDGNIIEGVLIPTRDRVTACVSSEVGCSMTCKFCATGYMYRKRVLKTDEIYNQVVQSAKHAELEYDQPLSKMVYMWMREELMRYSGKMKSGDRGTAPVGFKMAAKRITASTTGIAKMSRTL